VTNAVARVRNDASGWLVRQRADEICRTLGVVRVGLIFIGLESPTRNPSSRASRAPRACAESVGSRDVDSRLAVITIVRHASVPFAIIAARDRRDKPMPIQRLHRPRAGTRDGSACGRALSEFDRSIETDLSECLSRHSRFTDQEDRILNAVIKSRAVASHPEKDF